MPSTERRTPNFCFSTHVGSRSHTLHEVGRSFRSRIISVATSKCVRRMVANKCPHYLTAVSIIMVCPVLWPLQIWWMAGLELKSSRLKRRSTVGTLTNGTKFLVVAPFPISLASLAWDHRDFLSTNYSPATLLRP
jgi:hypothetical protein